MKNIGKKFLSDLKLHSDYLRWRDDVNRYETWEEATSTIISQHRLKYSGIDIEDELKFVEEFVNNKKVLFSQRNLQFRGDDIFKHNARLFNCSVTFIDRPEVFKQIMYLLLCGCGVGFSVEKLFIDRLPSIKQRNSNTVTYIIPDSIEGWSLALDKLITSFFNGSETIRFDYSEIRPKNSLIASKFLAPGSEPLKKSLEIIEDLLNNLLKTALIKDTKLSSVNIYDIICHASDAVLSAGLRRSALICLFDKDDTAMMNAKTGNWYIENPQRARSNNSVKLIEGEYTKEEYDKFANAIKEYGEPGFFIVKDKYFLTNPCGEISFIPINPTTGNSCVSFCNLCEINATSVDTLAEFLDRIKAATIIGTLQSGYTSFPFLGQDTEQLTAWESLLGVSITGWFDNPKLFNPEWLELGANYVLEINEKLAAKLGINPTARATTVKPSGNASVVLQTPSGIHADHSRNYFRIMQLNKDSEVSTFLEKQRPEMLEESVWSANKTDYAVYIPITLNNEAIVKSDISSIEFLEKVKLVQKHWILPGTVKERGYSSRVNHNVSNTVIVDDWDETFKYVYDNKEYFSGLSFLPKTGDKIYRQAPFTEVLMLEDLVSKYNNGVLFVSGLIVDLLHAFNNDLWEACDSIIDNKYFLTGNNLQVLMKKDLIRRSKKYAKNYFKGNLDTLISCIKDVHLYHKWNSINRNFKVIDVGAILTKPKYLNADEMGAKACYGNSCEI